MGDFGRRIGPDANTGRPRAVRWPIELRHLFAGEIPADRAEVLPELLFVARADNDAGHGGALQEPVQRELRSAPR